MWSHRCCGNVTDGETNHVCLRGRPEKHREQKQWLVAGRSQGFAALAAVARNSRWVRSRDGLDAVHATIAYDHRLARDTEREPPAADDHVRAHLGREGHVAARGA